MTYNLQDLAARRDALVLAEIAAILHDWQKCIPCWKKLGAKFNPGDIASILDSVKPEDPLKLSADISSLKQIIERGSAIVCGKVI